MKSLSSFHCPACGAEVYPNARGCRECGARRDTGTWAPSATEEVPDLSVDLEDFEEELLWNDDVESTSRVRVSAKKIFWWCTAVVTLCAFVWLSFSGW